MSKNFVAEIEAYNQCFDAKLEKDPKFGKSLKGSKKFDTPPYYAIQIFPLARKNFGGVKTDLRCRVLNKYFEPIPGLYAAGEVAGMAGGHINGKAGLEGTMLGPSIFSGRSPAPGPPAKPASAQASSATEPAGTRLIVPISSSDDLNDLNESPGLQQRLRREMNRQLLTAL